MKRRVMHLDMDAFYASVEQVDNPELKGKPVIVGGAERGVVSACSYEARRFGVHSAMPCFQARRLCPQGVFLPVRMHRYKEASEMVMKIIEEHSPVVEQVSIDEAFADITGCEALYGSPIDMALKIKREIYEKTFLSCSIGLAPNKLLAKIASDMQKPNGLTIVNEEDIPSFMAALPIGKIPGLGARSVQELKTLGIRMASDVTKFPASYWAKRLGKNGLKFYEKALGKDDSPLCPDREPKSVGAENTFSRDTDDADELKKWLLLQAERVGRELRECGYEGKTITLKLKFSDFKQITRSHSLREPTNSTGIIFDTASRLLEAVNISRKVRLTGVSVSNLSKGMKQARCFEDSSSRKQKSLDEAVDKVRLKFGKKALERGRVFGFKE